MVEGKYDNPDRDDSSDVGIRGDSEPGLCPIESTGASGSLQQLAEREAR